LKIERITIEIILIEQEHKTYLTQQVQQVHRELKAHQEKMESMELTEPMVYQAHQE
jgi:Tfp pilus assembly protein PilP